MLALHTPSHVCYRMDMENLTATIEHVTDVRILVRLSDGRTIEGVSEATARNLLAHLGATVVE